MVETILSQNRGSLLPYVVSRLRPEVFSHPIWVHFGNKEKLISPVIIEELLNAASQLQDIDPYGACQVLLICAVHQNYAGRRDEALRTTQQIMSLAEQNSLSREIVWATWGACAICFQEGDYEQTARHLQSLQIRLREQNEWVLANFIETVEQSLPQYNSTAKAGESEPSLNQMNADLMRITFDWLQQWGFFTWPPLPEFQAISSQLPYHFSKKKSSSDPICLDPHWKRYWFTIKKVLTGELRLRWVTKNTHPRTGSEMQHPALSSPPPNPHSLETSPSLSSQPSVQEFPSAMLAASMRSEETFTGASLLVYCLGTFRVYQNEQPVEDWPSAKGKAVFKYLVTHREHPVIKDVLMDLFWHDSPAESARNNLNVAIYSLRQVLRKAQPSYSHVLFVNDCYLLNPELHIWLDYEAFLRSIAAARELEKSGDLEATINEYSKAEALYQGEFLAEDRYEDWLLPLRENLRAEYISLLDCLNHHFLQMEDYQACIHLCRKMLTIDPCSEEAHRHLMRCFFERGQSYMALRQYHLCAEALKEGLSVNPASATKELFEYIRRHS